MLKFSYTVLASVFIILNVNVLAQDAVSINIDAASEKRPVSPYIYGKNNSLSDNQNVLRVESKNFKTNNEWRSRLYPEDWKPGYRDEQGRFLHDFSYAGYHKGEKEPPHITDNVVDITQVPYNADHTGTDDVTTIMQQALDDVGSAGGGVVYLPAGTYRIKPPANSDYGLQIRYDNTVLPGS